MKLSLVFPVLDTRKQILTHAQDLFAFWLKFPIDIEVLFVADPLQDFSAQECDEELQALGSETRVKFRLLVQKSRQGRGASILRGLREATGEVIGVNSLDLAIPLAELFSGLQEFIVDRDQSFFLIGNRRGTKKKRRLAKSGLRAFFEGVEHDKAKALGVADPTCPFFMIKKKDWDGLEISHLRSWFYTPGILQVARQHGLAIRELEIQSMDHPKSRFRLRDAFT